MVSSKQGMESEYVTADLVDDSHRKELVITGPGKYEEVTFDNKKSEKLTLPVEFNGVAKIWRPNRDSVKNLNRAFGDPTEDWVGKPIPLQVMSIGGRDSVVAVPKVMD